MRRITARTLPRADLSGFRESLWLGGAQSVYFAGWPVSHGALPYCRRRWRVGVSPRPDFVIDDYPSIVRYFGGYHIPEFYFARDDDDDELETVYQVVTELAATGRSTRRRWSPPAAPLAVEEV